MTDASRHQRRAFLRIAVNCLPVKMPWLATVTLLLAADHWPNISLLFWALIALAWVHYCAASLYDMPQDIFENYRQDL